MSSIAIARRVVRYHQSIEIFFDAYDYNEHGEWTLLARAIGPSLIKEFFNIEVTK